MAVSRVASTAVRLRGGKGLSWKWRRMAVSPPRDHTGMKRVLVKGRAILNATCEGVTLPDGAVSDEAGRGCKKRHPAPDHLPALSLIRSLLAGPARV